MHQHIYFSIFVYFYTRYTTIQTFLNLYLILNSKCESGTDMSLWKGLVSNTMGVKCLCSLLGDHRPTSRAGQQWIPAGMSWRCEGEGEGRDDHLLPHKRPPTQLAAERLTAA